MSSVRNGLVLIITLATAALASAALPEHLSALGWTNVTLIADHTVKTSSAKELVKTLSEANVQAAVLRDTSLIQHVGKAVVMGGNKSVDFLKDFLSRGNRPPYRAILYQEEGSSDEQFEDEFKDFGKPSGFFRLKELPSGKATFSRVQTFRDQSLVVEDTWKLDPSRRTFTNRTWDLKGATLTSISGTWEPWLYQHDCARKLSTGVSENCKTSGILSLLMDLLQKRLNFTVRYDDMGDDWGTVPVFGNESYSSAVWSGILGGVFGDEYDMSLNVWTHTVERELFGDFTTDFYTRPQQVVLNILQPKVDFAMFVRPFTSRSWVGICSIAVVLGITLKMLLVLNERTIPGDSFSLRIAVAFAWTFFVLVYAYYGGALTMFLSTESTPPFETAREVIQLYPKWKLIIYKGEEMVIHSQAARGDPVFRRYWEIMQENPELIQPTGADALKMLARPGYVLFQGSPLHVAKDYVGLQRKDHDLHLKLLRPERTAFSSIVLSNHSPLREMFNLGIQEIKQSGTLDALKRKGVLAMPKSFGSPPTDPLGARRLGLMFVLYLAVVLAAAAVLLAEVVFKRIAARLSARFIVVHRTLAN